MTGNSDLGVSFNKVLINHHYMNGMLNFSSIKSIFTDIRPVSKEQEVHQDSLQHSFLSYNRCLRTVYFCSQSPWKHSSTQHWASVSSVEN